MHPVVDRDIYRVDGVISGDFVAEGVPPYDLVMPCFKPEKWLEVVTAEVQPCPYPHRSSGEWFPSCFARPCAKL